ncbi:hypothetical protein [Siccibacter turicensis]
MAGKMYLPGSAFPGEEGINVARKGIRAMEMREIYALLIAISAAMSLVSGGWTISDIHIQVILNIGN